MCACFRLLNFVFLYRTVAKMASCSTEKTKRKRNELTLSQRYAAIQHQSAGKGTRELARLYGCSTTQITWCIEHRNEIEQRFEQNVNSEVKRLRVAPNQDINSINSIECC